MKRCFSYGVIACIMVLDKVICCRNDVSEWGIKRGTLYKELAVQEILTDFNGKFRAHIV